MRGACCWRALEETQTQDGTGALRLSTEITPPLSSPRRAPSRGSGRAPRGHASRRRATYTVHHRRARAQRSATDRRLSRRPTSPRKVRPSVSPNCNTAHHKPAAPDSAIPSRARMLRDVGARVLPHGRRCPLVGASQRAQAGAVEGARLCSPVRDAARLEQRRLVLLPARCRLGVARPAPPRHAPREPLYAPTPRQG